MNGFLRLTLAAVLMMSSVRCSTLGQGEDSPATEDSAFGDFDSGSESSSSSSANSEEAPSESSEVSLEKELNQSEGAPSEAANTSAGVAQDENTKQDEFSEFEQAESPPVVQAPIEPAPVEEIPPPIVEPVPVVESAQVPLENKTVISNIRYKANDNGGTLVIDGSQPLQYQTRMNAETNQLVIEIPNSNLPDKLKRPINTKDMSGGIGAVDAYQNSGSTTARIVIQMRPGAPEPSVQPEGNSLLVIQAGGAAPAIAENSTEGIPEEPLLSTENGSSDFMTHSSISAASSEGEPENSKNTGESVAKTENSILSSASLSEFLSGNTQFYGSPMSIDVADMEVRDVFKLIAEESGTNIVLSDDIKGSITLKLKDVPWDQIFVIMLKSKKLGYTRSGNILRVATMTDIKAEEAEALGMIAARKAQESLKIKVVPVSYADVKKIETDITKFLSERGKVVSDSRTSSLMITDHEENIARVEKLIKAIDIPPPQVLIEGKIVEATDQFQRQIGVNWSASGQESAMGVNSSGRIIRGRSTTNVAPTASTIASAGQIGFSMGTLDVLGDISATLSLFENNSQVKVLSSPRIVTLHGEKAEINQSVQVPVLQETQTTTGVTRAPAFKDVALRLTVTPQITNDASVLLDVNVSRSFLGATVDQATQAKPVNIRSAQTKVMVRNAQTAVIGGVYQSDQTVGEQKIPWIGDIPILGWLFKNRSDDSTKNELLIFLTPKILGQADSQVVPTELGGVN